MVLKGTVLRGAVLKSKVPAGQTWMAGTSRQWLPPGSHHSKSMTLREHDCVEHDSAGKNSADRNAPSIAIKLTLPPTHVFNTYPHLLYQYINCLPLPEVFKFSTALSSSCRVMAEKTDGLAVHSGKHGGSHCHRRLLPARHRIDRARPVAGTRQETCLTPADCHASLPAFPPSSPAASRAPAPAGGASCAA
jgi:hypothetical protein